MKAEIWHTKIYEMQQKLFLKEVPSNTGLPQETRKISNKQFNITPQGTRKGINEAQH